MLHRRTFLALTAAATAGPAIGEEAPALPPPKRVLDTHTHFYDTTRPQGVPWPRKTDKLLYRKVMPAEFKKLTAPHNVKATVVIEAVWPVEDNQWALDTLAPDAFIPGIIGRLPLDGDFEKNAARFAKHPKFRGIRVRPNELEEFAPYRWMEDRGWTVDILPKSSTFLSGVLALARQVPKLKIVVDHLPFNPLADPEQQKKADAALDELAKMPAVYIKVSNVLRAKRTDLQPRAADYRDQLDPIWERFGPKRVIFGSNWPVSDRGNGPYADVIHVMNEYMNSKGAEAKDRYFWRNGVEAYGLRFEPVRTAPHRAGLNDE